jgi:hypothetical protein
VCSLLFSICFSFSLVLPFEVSLWGVVLLGIGLDHYLMDQFGTFATSFSFGERFQSGYAVNNPVFKFILGSFHVLFICGYPFCAVDYVFKSISSVELALTIFGGRPVLTSTGLQWQCFPVFDITTTFSFTLFAQLDRSIYIRFVKYV